MRKIVLFFMFTFLGSLVHAQNLRGIEIDSTFGNRSFVEMTDLLYKKHHIHIFYKNEWIDEVQTPEIGNNILLESFLTRVLFPHDLHYLIFQGNVIVMPGAQIANESEAIESNVVIIGNPLNKGKYKTAILKGRILEGKTNSPIPGAQILCKKLSKGSSSDVNGYYSIELPCDENHIQFSFIGLTDELRDVIIYNDGELNIELYEKTIALNEINVTAERPEDNFRSTSMGMVKLNMKSIKKLSVLMGEPDVIKSMVMLPGVQSTGENASGFNVRGGNIDQNLILIHDAPVFNTSHLFGFFSMLDPGIVKDVTLYKSGIPAQYGGRIASVMNINLRKGEQDKIKVNGGIGIINSRISVEGPISSKITFMAGARTTYSDWMLKIINNYELQQSSANFNDFHAKLDYAINSKNRLSLFGYNSNDYFNYYQNAEYGYGNTLGSARWNHIFNNQNSSALSVNLSYYDANIVDFSHQNVEYNLNTSIKQEQFAYHFSSTSIARHKINAGVNAIHYLIEPGNSTPYSDSSIALPFDMPDEQAIELGFYLEDEFDITPELSVIAGLRYSNFMLNGPDVVNQYQENSPLNDETFIGSETINTGELSAFHQGLEPRIALRYEFDNSSSLKMGYNRTMQYIQQISNSASITPADYWKSSDQFIQPLISDQYALGYFQNFKNNTYEASLEAYYKDIQHVVDYKNGAQLILNPDLEQDLISGVGNAYGVELLIKKTKGNVTGWLAYTYSRSFKKVNGQFAEEKINNGNWYKSTYDKPHDLTLAINYKISRRFTFNSNFTFSTGRPVTLPEQKYTFSTYEIISFSDRNKYRLPDYHRLDLSFTYEGSLRQNQKWKNSWTFSIYNVYGRNNAFSVFYEKQTPSNSNNYRNYALFKFSVIGVAVPSFTYNFWF